MCEEVKSINVIQTKYPNDGVLPNSNGRWLVWIPDRVGDDSGEL